ncbi:protein BCCIP homolog isoform X1 [Ricinus communis]|uniref:protein BCCIP homolog isoform X1 n=1 Tax=Ricinus communis TaxID=3988 RepID=UPI00201AC89E|nr:protein BCCIP homolog isoform X1 [Ricinus communis]XP_015580019.2 protein BCCIP homolog isoform X1 [Ricinus communis]XP_048230779.1 protein BCCIP homolog isoform X1 [Ricinus communis]XP_048230780.1 protein BCCIP homolog isoform X1 [Ricinus communis]
MPPKRSRWRRSTMARPLTYSPFARSVAHLASSYLIKRQKLNNKLLGSSPSALGDGIIKHSSKEKNKQSESSEEEELEGFIQADFVFFDPKPDEFHGVKILLQTYLDNKEWDLSGFVDIILGQTTVGTVVKIEDDEDGLFSVTTVLNLGRYKDHKCIMDIKEFLIKVCLERNILDDLRLLLGEQAQYVGLLVSQRVVNLPPELLPPLYDALFDEVLWATEDEPTEELRKSFCFKSYLLITKIYKHKNADQKKRQSSDNEEAIIYIKPEDEIFYKHCSWSCCFPLHSEHVTTHELRNYRLMGLVMAVEADEISKFREELHSLIDES